LILVLAAGYRLLNDWYNTNIALLITGIVALVLAGGITWFVTRLTR
jgi:hypothetical protein